MVRWQDLADSSEIKDLFKTAVFRASPDSGKIVDGNHLLRGVVVNKGGSGNGYNIIALMDTPDLTKDTKMKVFCSCDDFTFRCAYVLHTHGALIAPKRFVLEPPKKTNPDETLRVCKHIKAFLSLAESGFLKTVSNRHDSI